MPLYSCAFPLLWAPVYRYDLKVHVFVFFTFYDAKCFFISSKNIILLSPNVLLIFVTFLWYYFFLFFIIQFILPWIIHFEKRILWYESKHSTNSYISVFLSFIIIQAIVWGKWMSNRIKILLLIVKFLQMNTWLDKHFFLMFQWSFELKMNNNNVIKITLNKYYTSHKHLTIVRQ